MNELLQKRLTSLRLDKKLIKKRIKAIKKQIKHAKQLTK